MIKKGYIKIFTVILLVFLILLIFNNMRCFALSDVIKGKEWGNWVPELEESVEFTEKVNGITKNIRIVGILISVITLSIIGIKFMIGSVEEKANYKQTMGPWILGATMLFTITFIPTTIYELTTGALKEIDTSVTENGRGNGNSNVEEDDLEKVENLENYILGYENAMDDILSDCIYKAIDDVVGEVNYGSYVSIDTRYELDEVFQTYRGELKKQINNSEKDKDYKEGYLEAIEYADKFAYSDDKAFGTLNPNIFAEGLYETKYIIDKIFKLNWGLPYDNDLFASEYTLCTVELQAAKKITEYQIELAKLNGEYAEVLPENYYKRFLSGYDTAMEYGEEGYRIFKNEYGFRA